MRIVESGIDIAVSPEKVIDAFTNPELLREWWGVERSLIQLQPAGVYTLAWGISEQGIKYVSSGIIKEYHPDKILHIEKYTYLNPERSFLGPMELKVSVTPIENGSSVLLTQGPYPENVHTDWDWLYKAVVDAWPKVLEVLKKFLEQKFT